MAAISSSEVRQAFGKLGWLHGKTSVNLSFAYADNWLTGNGLQDLRFLEQNYPSVYSVPDITWNRSPSLNLSLRHSLQQSDVFGQRLLSVYSRRHYERGYQ